MKNRTKIIPIEDNQDIDNDVDLNNSDDIDTFIRKTQLQNLVLKKLTENLSRTTDRNADLNKPKS